LIGSLMIWAAIAFVKAVVPPLADSVRGRWLSQLFLFAVLDGLCEALHAGDAIGDICLGGGDQGVAGFGRVFLELDGYRDDVGEAAAVADTGKDSLCCSEGAVVVCGECLLDDVGVEAIHSEVSIADQDVETVVMLLAQEFAELVDAGLVAEDKFMEEDGRVAAILGREISLLELRIVLKSLDCFGASKYRACAEVDDKRPESKK
jgi:hypothetical protein